MLICASTAYMWVYIIHANLPAPSQARYQKLWDKSQHLSDGGRAQGIYKRKFIANYIYKQDCRVCRRSTET